ncbi:MAG: diaminopimelate epimerase [Candidatus Gastranaerophilaceae bacterium]|jgi:diaminopimelate epimerase|nr:MAG TPA: diaminopimelate epimerase [Candidatus Gastranaerophilales bacterium HUM_21]
MTQVKFTKMQGAGNDFILMEYGEYKKIEDKFPEIAVKLCDRHFGIGADGIFVPVENPKTYSDLEWLFYQADGSTAQMCGNGMRCFARFCFDKKIVNKRKFTVHTGAGKIVPEVLEDLRVKVNMGKPILEPEKIPFKGSKNLNYPLWDGVKKFTVNAVSMGNPHCVIFVKDDEDNHALAKKYGDAIEHDNLFPEKTNVEFVKVISREEIDVAVWERGCGITLACGTGACASVVAAILNGLCDNKVKVNLPGGSLTIEWAGNSQNTDFDVLMTGEAQYVYTGIIEI